MYRLSLILIFVFALVKVQAQSPHEKDLGMECSKCHHAGNWQVDFESVAFNHDSTNFSLEGQHKITDCIECHASLVFNQAASDCFSCHTDVHSMSLGNDCARCHETQTWLVDFIPELHEMSLFPLIGAHASASCIECHSSDNDLVFERIGNECTACHIEDYNASQNPNHISVGFSTDCIQCHSAFESDWNADQINHDYFPLILGHDIENCTDCHQVNDYTDISPVCSSCHMEDYLAASDPNHVELGFSTSCGECHTEHPGWSPASFTDHSFFPLTQGHTIFDCTACHTSTDYSDISSDCFACHEADYASAQSPNHTNSGFSTDCAECHTTSPNWSPASFDHDSQYFPIYSGEHKNEWDECIDCHTNSSNFAIFSCFKCHSQNDMDDEHDDENGYSYNSNACLHCHPDGDD